MIPEDAIAVMAEWAMANQVAELDWQNFPDIGEADWLAIQKQAAWITPRPSAEQYIEAYTLLEQRATVWETSPEGRAWG